MANRKHRIDVEIRGESKDAEQAFDSVGKKSEGLTGRIGKLSTAMKVGLVAAAAAAVAAIRGLATIVGGGVAAAQEQEDAVNSLRASLQGLGPQADAVTAALTQQAAALQQTSVFGDEAIISAQSFLSTLGVGPAKIEAATQATVDMAAALGIDLESAARNVGKTMGGFAGELSEVIPELKNLTAEQLKAGEGVDLLAAKFAGRAQAELNTFSGQLKSLKNAWGDVTEEIGFAITKNAGIQAALARLKVLVTDPKFVGAITQLATEIVEFTVKVAEFTAKAIEKLQQLAAFLEPVTSKLNSLFGITAAKADQASESVKKVADAVDQTSPPIDRMALKVAALAGATDQATASVQKLDDAANTLGVVTSRQLELEIQKVAEALEVQRNNTELSAAEFDRMEAVAAEKIDRLKTRIEGLRDGMGDVTEATTGATTSVVEYGASLTDAAVVVDNFASAQSRMVAEIERGNAAAAVSPFGTGKEVGSNASYDADDVDPIRRAGSTQWHQTDEEYDRYLDALFDTVLSW